jgi:hypothetical protein
LIARRDLVLHRLELHLDLDKGALEL